MQLRIKLPTLFCILCLLARTNAKLVPEYNLKDIGDFEVIKDEYKILYKEHLYSLKENIDDFIDQNEVVLYETYQRLSDMLNNTRVDTSGKLVLFFFFFFPPPLFLTWEAKPLQPYFSANKYIHIIRCTSVYNGVVRIISLDSHLELLALISRGTPNLTPGVK